MKTAVEEATEIIDSLGEITANLDPASKRLIEQRAQRVRVLAERASGIRASGVVDAAVNLAADVATLYANSVNASGAKMRGRDCRSGLRRTMDAADVEEQPTISDAQKLEAWKRSEAYATECRRLHRQGNPLAVR
jgi:hypothetical protein